MKLLPNFMPDKDILDRIKKECHWGNFTINNQVLKRTGSFEGIVSDTFVPWLRCPSIENQEIYPMCSIVKEIRDKILLEYGCETNIAKIQKYTDGETTINPHADKILDLEVGQPIFFIRFGEKRTLVLQNKMTKEKKRIEMPHNTLFIMDYNDNLNWTHSIEKEKVTDASYSIIFRKSVTFLHKELKIVFGKHCPLKTEQDVLGTKDFSGFFTKQEQKEALVKLYNKENKNVISLKEYQDVMEKAIYP